MTGQIQIRPITLNHLLITLVVILATSTQALAQKRQSVGSWLRQRVDHVHNRLENSPKARQKINRGIDRFADNVIDFATPQSDKQTRRAQRDAVHMVLNPSRSEKDRRFNSLIQNVTGADRTIVSSSRNRGHRTINSYNSKRGSISYTRSPSNMLIDSKSQHSSKAQGIAKHYATVGITMIQGAHQKVASFWARTANLSMAESKVIAAGILGFLGLFLLILLSKFFRAVFRPKKLLEEK
ncbi:hypothetical protein Pan241w_18170 [Gimesia alba]|uniref:Uncharacterized protein n=1 Tax=Gimesia alba TaxID=2527973 RepID=A0A517RD44_9PLAN|nr:hypothetical protein [Gimesia alba]QDT41754.1 hypothetical protein Pan241w_18170 [Gimesia alba]